MLLRAHAACAAGAAEDEAPADSTQVRPRVR
jgi:hypothetical protein